MIDVSSLPQQAPDYDLRELLEAGCHFGHQARRWHPKMAKWIYTEKDGVHIFDLAKTAEQLKVAYNYAYDLGAKGKTLIVVGTKKQARDIIKEVAVPAGVMSITSRWLGGLLTNWEQVGRSLRRMIEIETGLKEGKFDVYTKRERVLLDKERQRLERFFGGIRELKGKPDALFIIDPSREKVAVLEASRNHIPMMALIDSNTNPELIDIPVPANDDAVKSIQYIVNAVVAGYAAGKKAK
ncbi:30S ribosomal protein S2 [Patescibacteria group bacterium]|nr:30S ribosomal protein S2 [Patescibacteria group bacterium]